MIIIPHRRYLEAQVLVLLLLVVLILHPPVFTLAQARIWTRTYGGEGYDIARALIQTTDGGYALAGETSSYGAGSTDCWLVKTDSQGIMEWNQTYGGKQEDIARALIQTTDGGYALAGETSSYGAGSTDCWLVKTDSQGIMEWIRTYGGKQDDYASALLQTTDGGYALAGWTKSSGAGGYDFWLVKTDSQGILQWSQTYGRWRNEYAWALLQTTDGGYALAGDISAISPDVDYFAAWLVKTDSWGIPQWNQTYGGEDYDTARALIQTSDGGYALGGETASYGTGFNEFWLVKTDSQGIFQWNQTYGGAKVDGAQALIQTADEGYALGGLTESYGAGSTDYWLVKTDSNGIPQWSQTYGGEKHESAHALIQTSDGGYALAGRTASYGAGGLDYWLVKTEGRNFSITSTGTETITSPRSEGINFTITEVIDFLIPILWYLVIVVGGSSVGLLASRLVYRRYSKWR